MEFTYSTPSLFFFSCPIPLLLRSPRGNLCGFWPPDYSFASPLPLVFSSACGSGTVLPFHIHPCAHLLRPTVTATQGRKSQASFSLPLQPWARLLPNACFFKPNLAPLSSLFFRMWSTPPVPPNPTLALPSNPFSELRHGAVTVPHECSVFRSLMPSPFSEVPGTVLTLTSVRASAIQFLRFCRVYPSPPGPQPPAQGTEERLSHTLFPHLSAKLPNPLTLLENTISVVLFGFFISF